MGLSLARGWSGIGRGCRSLGLTLWLLPAALGMFLASDGCWLTDRSSEPGLVCVAGSCSCAEGLGDCDGDPATGCETDVRTSALHCGSCGQTCEHGHCIGGLCDCEPWAADCDHSASNGCEVDLRSDGENCGTCGRSCDGGACLEKVCQPVELASVPTWPSHLVLDPTYAFVTGSAVMAYRLDGSEPPTVVDPDGGGGADTRDGLLYWVASDGVASASPGEPATVLATPASSWTSEGDLVATATDLYWCAQEENQTDTMLLRAPRSGGGAVQIVASAPERLAADERFVYWTFAGATIRRMPVTGGPIQDFVTGSDVRVLTTAGGYLYWAEGWSDASIRRVPQDGGETSLLFEAANSWVGALAVDETLVVFSYAAGGAYDAIGAVRLSAPGAMLTLAQGQVSIVAVGLGPRHVYWLTDTKLMRVVRP